MHFHRYDNLHRIQQLDPVEDHCQIYHLMVGYEFPWDLVRSLEVALMKTYCVPSISKLLDKTGEFRNRPQKRYDDTSIIVVEICKWGYESERGRQAIARMNAIHGRFPIANEDFLYVLSTFIYDPIRWNARFGWRWMCEQEKLASFYFWREIGQRMHIQNIPPTYEEFERYNLDYERQHFCYSDTNRRVGEATRDLFLSWFPWWMRSPLKPLVYALLDDPMLDAFGFEHPSQLLRTAIASILKLRGLTLRFLPPHQQSQFFSDSPIRSYPNGYEIANLGPPENKYR
ncbi:MAG: oxygenase MpaB family protein [Nostoc sp. EkiNYC01]|nr:oxygenase MpaB family protein [Nostoc sp. EkiNYC01]